MSARRLHSRPAAVYLSQRQNELVGFDVELLNMLATEMEVRLELVPLAWDTLKNQVNSGEVDIVGSMPLSTHMLIDLDLSDPYLPGE